MTSSTWDRVVLILIALLLTARTASAQTKETITYGAGLGTLTYELQTFPKTCESEYGEFSYTIYSFSDFVYDAPNSTDYPLNGSTYWDYGIGGRLVGSGNCPEYISGGSIIDTGSGPGNSYTVTITPHSNGTLSSEVSVPGYTSPKFIVLGVLYTPPAGIVTGGVAKGNVSYTDSDLVSSTTTTKSSFTSGYTETQVETQGESFSIMGYANGSSTNQSTSSYTMATTTADSTAVTVQKTTGTTVGVNGPECSYTGVDHDYDLIEVWLNPVQLFTLVSNGTVQPNGYGYSTLDQPGMDVYDVYAGELNGALPMRQSTTEAFARAWASVEVWPAGQSPALTAQDEQNIQQTDPYFDCTWESPWSDSETSPCAKPPDPTRFTETAGDQSFPYTQPDPGGSPNNKAYMFSYTNTDTQGTDVTYTYTQSTGLEKSFSATIFGISFGKSLSQTWTTTFAYETSSQFTSSNTTSATATIWQPPCNVVSGACDPVYPPANAFNPITCAADTSLPLAFGQGDNFYIYQDNLFGTFLMEPYIEGQ